MSVQFGIETVYQDDSFALLNATETGRAITSNIVAFTAPFSKYIYVQEAVIEVKFFYILVITIHSKINIGLSFKTIYHTVFFCGL